MQNRYFSFLLVFLLVSCSEDTNVATFTTSVADFNHSMLIDGFVEPVLTTTITSPVPCDGTIEYLVEDGVYVEEGQVVCIIEWQQMQTQYEQISLSLERAEVGINKTKADLNLQMALLEAQVKTNEANTRIAQMDSLQIAFMSLSQRLIKELELERASIEKARYEKKLASLKVIQQSEIKRLELEIQRFRTNVQTIKERLDALTLKAPRSGLILRSNSPITDSKLNIGDPIWSNFPIATMPKFEQMKVKIRASEADFKSISVNDSVYYTFDAMPGNTGKGIILKKVPMGRPYKRGSTVKFFEIEASIDSVTVMPEPGFTANCRIIIKQEDKVIAIPQIALFDDDSLKIVFVERKKGFEKRQVLTGLSSPNESVITAGLQEGEVITLSKPKPSLVKAFVALPDSLTKKPETPIDSVQNRHRLPLSLVPN